MKSSSVVSNVLAWAMTCVAVAQAAEAPAQTVVTVKGMHCAGCAAKVSKKLQSLVNVKTATVDAEKGTAAVVPASGKEVSPKAVWEAIESAGYKPLELQGPAGTFKTKPMK